MYTGIYNKDEAGYETIQASDSVEIVAKPYTSFQYLNENYYFLLPFPSLFFHSKQYVFTKDRNLWNKGLHNEPLSLFLLAMYILLILYKSTEYCKTLPNAVGILQVK